MRCLPMMGGGKRDFPITTRLGSHAQLIISLSMAFHFWITDLCIFVRGLPSADEVHSLPGWDAPLLSRTFAGYVEVRNPRYESHDPRHVAKEHYMLFCFEGDSTDEGHDRLLMWTNGGPGASSFLGAFSEVGPYFLVDTSLGGEIRSRKLSERNNDTKHLNTNERNDPTTHTTNHMTSQGFNSTKHTSGTPTRPPRLFKNAFRWTRLGHLLIRNLPPPVGFSYCGDAPDGDGYSCGNWTDQTTAEHSAWFLRNFFEQKFPEWLGVPDSSPSSDSLPSSASSLSRELVSLYLMGESYAGVYVPTMAREVLHIARDDQYKHDPYWQGLAAQVAGVAVGDGCTVGTLGGCWRRQGPYYQLLFLYGHGQISTKTWERVLEECPRAMLIDGPLGELRRVYPRCASALDKADAERGFSFDYNLYDECYDFGLGGKTSGIGGNLWHARRTPLGENPWNSARTSTGTLHEERRQLGTQHQEASTMVKEDDKGDNTDHASLRWAMDGRPCGGTQALSEWVERDDVRAALHVSKNAMFVNTDNGVNFSYSGEEPDTSWWYKREAERNAGTVW